MSSRSRAPGPWPSTSATPPPPSPSPGTTPPANPDTAPGGSNGPTDGPTVTTLRRLATAHARHLTPLDLNTLHWSRLAHHHANPHQIAAALITAGVTKHRDETPASADRPTRCAHCAGALPTPAPTGRPGRWCSPACRTRAWRQRHTTGRPSNTASGATTPTPNRDEYCYVTPGDLPHPPRMRPHPLSPVPLRPGRPHPQPTRTTPPLLLTRLPRRRTPTAPITHTHPAASVNTTGTDRHAHDAVRWSEPDKQSAIGQLQGPWRTPRDRTPARGEAPHPTGAVDLTPEARLRHRVVAARPLHHVVFAGPRSGPPPSPRPRADVCQPETVAPGAGRHRT
jgi:hypothetical protein